MFSSTSGSLCLKNVAIGAAILESAETRPWGLLPDSLAFYDTGVNPGGWRVFSPNHSPTGRSARLNRQNERLLPADHGNFVHQENDCDRWRGPGGQSVASKEVQRHACPARADSDESAADIWHSDCGRELRAKDVPEPEDLT